MRSCFLFLAALAFVWVGVITPTRAFAENDSRLVLIEPHATTLSKNARERLHDAIADVVKSHGIALVAKKALSDKLQHCDLPGCLPQIAAATGAIYVLYVDAKFAQESFHLAIQLWNTDEGKLLGQDGRDCPICDEQDLWGSAALMTRGLLDRTLAEPQKSLPPSPALAAKPPVAVAAAPAASTQPQVQVAHSSNGTTYAGLALAVAGLSALGIGVYYWSVDGNCSDSTCDYVRDTRKLGIPMTLGGGALLAAGAGLLAWRFWPRGASVSLSPSGLRLAGSF